MKKINIIISKTNLSSFENMINNNKSMFEDKFSSNFILVPDKFTLNAEKLIFELLNIKSTFNIDVVSFNRLAYKVFNKANLNVLSKRKGIILINKIILENRDKIKTFNKLVGKNGLTENIYETIMQFKSSGILPSEVSTNDINSHLKGKLDDIKLIYNEYENYLSKGYIDEPHRLTLLKERIKTSDLIKTSSIFIGMFDDFTYLQTQVIKELILNAKNVVIALSANSFQSNSDIYINENLQKIISICKQNNFDYNIENLNTDETQEIKQIQNNLFAITKKQKINTENIKLINFDNINDEIEFVCKTIKAFINIKGYNYKDFNVAVGGLANLTNNISNIFNKYELPFYIDDSNSLQSSVLFKFIISILECYRTDFSKNKLFNLIKSPFIRYDNEIKNTFENYINKYGLDYSKIFEEFKYEKEKSYFNDIEKFRIKITNILKKVSQIFTGSKFSYEFSDGIIELLNFVEYENTINELLDLELNLLIKKNLQVSFDKFVTLIRDIDSVFEQKITVEDYIEMLLSMMQSECFKNIPIQADMIMIADASAGYFYKNDFMFVINSVEGIIPCYKNDCGIITDNEIERLTSKNILSPSIQFINKKEKNKIFNLLCTFKQKLFITYSTYNTGENNLPSEIVLQFKDMFNNVTINQKEIYTYFAKEFGKSNAERCYMGIFNNAVLNNVLNTRDINLQDCLNDEQLFKRLTYKLDYKIEKSSQDKVSISKIEKYNKCPFYSYCQDSLNLKEKELDGIKVIDVGTILHSVAELFGEYCINNNINEKEIEQIAIEIYNKVLENDNYSHLKINNLEYLSLKNESINLCKVIYYQTQNSDYKISKLEYKFKNFKVGDILLSGIIDRIDETEDYFNIIDYKTGKDKFSFADVYTGKKLQLIVYSYIYERLTNKQNSGFYYMPISNKFISTQEDFYKKYKLSGVTLNNQGVIKRIDKKLVSQNESDIINVKYTKSGEISKYCLNNILSNQELVSLKEYSINMLKQTYKELQSGNIEALPLEDSCKYCPYYSICGFNYLRQGERKTPSDITKEFFKKEQE